MQNSDFCKEIHRMIAIAFVSTKIQLYTAIHLERRATLAATQGCTWASIPPPPPSPTSRSNSLARGQAYYARTGSLYPI